MIDPLVSVLMTAYNREKYIEEAIERVLASTYTNFELIIVDDCSKDLTVEIAKSYAERDNRIQVYLNDKNLGDYPNRNRAASYAKGKYLKYLDSDDMIYPESLKIMVNSMEEFTEAGFCVSSKKEMVTSIFTPKDAYELHFFERSLLDYAPTGILINTDKFKEFNGFKLIRNVSDFDLWLRMAAKYPVIELPRDLVFWREHEEQEINIAPEFYTEFNLEILNENFSSVNCPLSAEQQKIIIDKIRKQTARGLLKALIKKGKLASFLKIRKKYSLNFEDII